MFTARSASSAVAALILLAGAARSQAFEVASIRASRPGGQPYSNFPLGPGDVYSPNGGLFSTMNQPLVVYIFFAFKLNGNQGQYVLRQLPDWVSTEAFDIQARAKGTPGKDEMRQMLRALLSDRFKLAFHWENREVPVLAMVLSKPGKRGPQLEPHPAGSPCPTSASPEAAIAKLPPSTIAGGLPALCNGIFPMPPSVPGRLHFAGRNVTLAFIADTFSPGTDLGRPMVDQTGLKGTFDFSLEWKQERHGPAAPGADILPEPTDITFEQALQEQLGISLKSRKGTVSVLVIDHVERPSPN